MLKRLTKRWEISIFQLYPKPRPKGQAEHAQEKSERSKGSPGLVAGCSPSRRYLLVFLQPFRAVPDRRPAVRDPEARGSKLWIPTAREKVLRRKGGKAIVRDLEEWCLMSNGIHPRSERVVFIPQGGGSATAKDGFATASRQKTGHLKHRRGVGSWHCGFRYHFKSYHIFIVPRDRYIFKFYCVWVPNGVRLKRERGGNPPHPRFKQGKTRIQRFCFTTEPLCVASVLARLSSDDSHHCAHSAVCRQVLPFQQMLINEDSDASRDQLHRWPALGTHAICFHIVEDV